MGYNTGDDAPERQNSPQQANQPNAAYDQARSRIASAYQTYLGRDGSDAEYASHLGNYQQPGDVDQRVGWISNSPEAQAYAKAQALKKQDEAGQAQQTGLRDSTQMQSVSGPPVTPTGQIQPYSPPTTTMPNAQPQTPAYQPGSYNVQTPAAYTPGTMPNAYGGSQFDQFTAPDQAGTNNQQNALIQAILSNPETMNPNVVAQLKERAKADSLSMGQQLGQQLDQGAIARGSLGSGALDAQHANINTDMIGRILNSNRDTDINAASTNRQDVLNALSASEGIASGQLGRATQGYNTRLGGQQAQAQDTQAASASALQRALAIEQQHQAQFDSQFRNANLGFDVQHAQNDENYRANQSQFLGETTRNDAQLNFLRYLEGARQFNGTLGFNYNQLDQNGQMSLLDWLSRN